MKKYDEMTERVFRRVHEYEETKSRRSKAMRRLLLAASPLCIAAVLGTAFYLNGLTVPPGKLDDVPLLSADSTSETVTSKLYETTSETEKKTVIATSFFNEKEDAETTSVQAAVTETDITGAASQENNSSGAVAVHEDNAATPKTTAVSVTSKNVQSSQKVTVTTVQSEIESAAPVNNPGGSSSMAFDDRIYTATINGALYLQITSLNGRSDLYTPDEMIGHGWDYQDDHYWDNTEIYTTKESKYILIARYEGGTEIILRRANDLIVGENEYFITAWYSGDYAVNEDNFIGTVSDCERIYTSYDSEVRDPNVILEPGCRLYTADENSDILIAVHTNGNAVILHKDQNT